MNVYGLIGYPLQHSFSKKYFTEKFEKEGIHNARFELFPIPSINGLPEVLQANSNLKGLAVTIPYKIQVIAFLSQIEHAAATIGAINCIRIKEGKLFGFNTDVTGFERSFVSLLKEHHKKALILGSGGASKAVQYVLNKLKIPFLVVMRNKNLLPGQLHYTQINKDFLEQYPVIINCTPVGMYPDEANKPAIPYQLLSSDNYLFDLVYKPEETLFLQEGKKYGAIVKNGFEMLLLQAEENWRIWNEKE